MKTWLYFGIGATAIAGVMLASFFRLHGLVTLIYLAIAIYGARDLIMFSAKNRGRQFNLATVAIALFPAVAIAGITTLFLFFGR